METLIDNRLIDEIEGLLQKARTQVAFEVNDTLLKTYMEIGHLIVDDMNNHKNNEDYQTKTISTISKELTKNLVKVFHVQIFGI